MSTPDPAVVTLRTGAEVPVTAVSALNLTMGDLMNKHPMALYEAVMIARDAAHVPFGNAGGILREYSLLDETGRMDRTVRTVILAATDGDGPGVRIISPYASDSATEARS